MPGIGFQTLNRFFRQFFAADRYNRIPQAIGDCRFATSEPVEFRQNLDFQDRSAVSVPSYRPPVSAR